MITYRQGNDERASRALDVLQDAFRCCGSDGRLSFQNNVPLSCNMYSVGCLTRTMMFLDDCMDVTAYLLLFASLIKLFITIYFYSFLCVDQRRRHKDSERVRHFSSDASQWRHSTSFDSTSSESIGKKTLLPASVTKPHEKSHAANEFVEKRRVILNEYDSHSSDKRVQNAAPLLSLPMPASSHTLSTVSFEQQAFRKLSSISERTEKTETDGSEPDLLRMKQSSSKQKLIITMVDAKQQPPPLPSKLPSIKNGPRPTRDDDNDQDSGTIDLTIHRRLTFR